MLIDTSLMSVGLTTAHAGLLCLELAWGLWFSRHDKGIVVCALYLLIWADLVATALFLSCFSALGSRYDYVVCSLAFGAVIAVWLRKDWLFSQAPRPVEHSRSNARSKVDRIVAIVLWVSIALVVAPTALLCWGYDPNNYDSVAYRLPRAFLYLARGTVGHLPVGDFRMQVYPFNITLAYLGMAIHGLSGRWMNLFSLVSWLVGGVAVARTAREFNARRTATLLAATLYLTTPAVLVSASSSNDDMIAGVPLLIGLLFASRWWTSGARTDAVLAATGVGLSAGSKLHLPFLVPVAALFLAIWAYRAIALRAPTDIGAIAFGPWPTPSARDPETFMSAETRARRHPFRLARVPQVAGAIVIVGLLSLPGFVINIMSVGRATPDFPNFQNAPFSFAIAGVNTLVDTTSLFLAPIPDLDLAPDMQDRKHLFDIFNSATQKHLFSWIPKSLDFTNSPFYRFDGLASSDGYWGAWEQSVWIGFVPWLLLMIALTTWQGNSLGRRNNTAALRFASLWLSIAFFGWHLARCVAIKYVAGQGIYYAFIMAIAAPALAWLWDGDGMGRRRRVFFRSACLVVLGTNLVGAANAFSYNVQRNIPALLRADRFDPRPSPVDADLRADLRRSARTLIAYTEWELPLFDLITVQPKARYALTDHLPAGAVPGYDLSFMLARIRSEYGELPVQFAHDDRRRLARLGAMQTVYGEQRAFGHGELPPPPAASVVAEYSAASDAGGLSLSAGWSPTERTHRWSEGPSSAMDFVLPAGETACALDLTAITLGAQHVTATLNGDAAGSFELDGWFPGKEVTLALPDKGLIPGHANHLVLAYDAPRKPEGDGRTLALGLVKAAVACRPGGGPDRHVVFDYQASGEADAAALTQGWSPSERTHRWSDAAESDIDFRLPRGRRACALDLRAITAGRQTVRTSLNDAPVATTDLESWFPGRDLHIDLPDEDLRPGAVNRIAFRFAEPRTAQGRALALGLISAAIRCRIDETGEADRPPLTRDGFAILELDQRRDARGALTAISPGRLNGVDADENFDIRLSLVSPAGSVLPVSDWAPIAWSTWIDLPSAPMDGAVHVQLRRRDRPDIAASIQMPVAAGLELGLDLRSPEDGAGISF